MLLHYTQARILWMCCVIYCIAAMKHQNKLDYLSCVNTAYSLSMITCGLWHDWYGVQTVVCVCVLFFSSSLILSAPFYCCLLFNCNVNETDKRMRNAIFQMIARLLLNGYSKFSVYVLLIVIDYAQLLGGMCLRLSQ